MYTAFVLVFFTKHRDLFGHFSKQQLSGFSKVRLLLTRIKARDKT
jgi:hypothetical protein